MWAVIFVVSVLSLGAAASLYECGCNRLAKLAAGFAAFLVLGGLLVSSTTGLYPSYSEGTRSGYITKASVKGLLWKTREVQIQVGSGEMASLQREEAMSVVDDNVWDAIQGHLSERVLVRYRQWLVMPWRYGETRYEIVDVVLLPKVGE